MLCLLTQVEILIHISLSEGEDGIHGRCVADSVIEPREIKAKPCNAA